MGHPHPHTYTHTYTYTCRWDRQPEARGREGGLRQHQANTAHTAGHGDRDIGVDGGWESDGRTDGEDSVDGLEESWRSLGAFLKAQCGGECARGCGCGYGCRLGVGVHV